MYLFYFHFNQIDNLNTLSATAKEMDPLPFSDFSPFEFRALFEFEFLIGPFNKQSRIRVHEYCCILEIEPALGFVSEEDQKAYAEVF